MLSKMIKYQLNQYLLYRRLKCFNTNNFPPVSDIVLSKIRLNNIEKKEILDRWAGMYPSYWKKEWIFKWFRFFKWECGYFDARFVPGDIYNSVFELALNPKRYADFLEYKGMLAYFIDERHRAVKLAEKINGDWYVAGDFANEKEVLKKIQGSGSDRIVIKKAIDSGGGHGVKLIDRDVIDSSVFSSLFCENDIVVEEYIKENDELRRYNPDVVNTIRVLSLNMNGRVSVLSSFLRMGGKGMMVDNVSSGGMFIGIRPDGSLFNTAYTAGLEKINNSPSGISFKGKSIESYSSVKEFVCVTHKNFPLAKLIAWDIAIDVNNDIKVIEINLNNGDVYWHQLYNGPLFGRRIDEVIEYIKDCKIKYIQRN